LAIPPRLLRHNERGGKRTAKRARAQAVLTSIPQTARQQGKNPLDRLIALLVGKDPAKILDLVPPTREIPQDSSPGPPPRRVRARDPLELVALYAVPKAVDGTQVSVQP